jgi:hypothetical protein
MLLPAYNDALHMLVVRGIFIVLLNELVVRLRRLLLVIIILF